jgi:DNA polymerase elongation subunit (family B)
VFKKFAENMKKKRNLNSESNFFYKLINNSLYGRLGMGHEETKTKLIKNTDDNNWQLDENLIEYTRINENYFLANFKTERPKIIKSNVIYASIITSKARIKLHKGFKSVEKSEGRILYSDTDSIFAAYKKNVDDMEFGEIK